MKTDSTYAKAYSILEILDSHDHRPKPHLVLVETLRTQFADIPQVADASNPYEMLDALEKLAPSLLRGEVRPGDRSQHIANYATCADAHMRLKARIAQYEAAA